MEWADKEIWGGGKKRWFFLASATFPPPQGRLFRALTQNNLSLFFSVIRSSLAGSRNMRLTTHLFGVVEGMRRGGKDKKGEGKKEKKRDFRRSLSPSISPSLTLHPISLRRGGGKPINGLTQMRATKDGISHVQSGSSHEPSFPPTSLFTG